jgi:hypothetical protein
LGEPENPVSLLTTKDKLFDAIGDMLTVGDKENLANILLSTSNSSPLSAVSDMMTCLIS